MRKMAGRKFNALIVFDDTIADVISNKRLSQVVTELFIRGKKLNLFTVFTAQIYFQDQKSYNKLHPFFYYENSK